MLMNLAHKFDNTGGNKITNIIYAYRTNAKEKVDVSASHAIIILPC